MISGGLIAGGLVSGGEGTGPAVPPTLPLAAAQPPALPGAPTPNAPQAQPMSLTVDLSLLPPEIQGDFLNAYRSQISGEQQYAKDVLGKLDASNKRHYDTMDKMLYGQVIAGGLNTISQIIRDGIQGSIAKAYFNSQIDINDRQADAATHIADKQVEWQTRAAESFDRQNELLYSRGGFAEQRERIHAQTAIAMNESKERGKTERAALRGVDEAFGLDSRDSYGYGNPFANA